jgi:hypothetical protein
MPYWNTPKPEPEKDQWVIDIFCTCWFLTIIAAVILYLIFLHKYVR